MAGETANYAYFPILVGSDFPISRDALYDLLASRGIHARRYFYPLISDFPMYKGLPSAQPHLLPVARRMASQILCLPIYPDLSDAEVETIAGIITQA